MPRISMLFGAACLLSSCAMVGPDFQKLEAVAGWKWTDIGEPAISIWCQNILKAIGSVGIRDERAAPLQIESSMM